MSPCCPNSVSPSVPRDIPMGTVCKQRSSELLHLFASFSSPPASAHPSNSADPKHQSPSVPCPSPWWCQQRWHLVTSLTDSSDNSGLCLQKPSQQMATTRGISLPSIYTQDLQAQICAPGLPVALGGANGAGRAWGEGSKGLSAEATLHFTPWETGCFASLAVQ